MASGWEAILPAERQQLKPLLHHATSLNSSLFRFCWLTLQCVRYANRKLRRCLSHLHGHYLATPPLAKSQHLRVRKRLCVQTSEHIILWMTLSHPAVSDVCHLFTDFQCFSQSVLHSKCSKCYLVYICAGFPLSPFGFQTCTPYRRLSCQLDFIHFNLLICKHCKLETLFLKALLFLYF